MNIRINRKSETAIYLQIKGAIKNMIAAKELTAGYKMPSERRLAEELSVHRNTVVKAYAELIAEGYLYASRQAPRGYFVNAQEASQTFSSRFFPLEKMIQYDFNEKENVFLDIYDESNQNCHISFGGLVMDRSAYPEVDCDCAVGMFRSTADEGARLKQNICKLLADENMYVNPKNIQIVSETNQAIDYLMDLFLHEGDTIIAEEPIVPDNVSLFRHKRIQLVTVPMEEDGMNLVALEALIAKQRPKFIYTIPNGHNPTGIVMSLEKRLKFLQLTRRYGIPVIEEDSQKDFWYTQNKMPSLYSLDNHKSVIYLYSFTLSFPYGIKAGYIVGPYDLAERLGRCITINESSVNNLGHYLLNEYIERGLFEKHRIFLEEHYRKKRDLLIEELDKIKDKGLSYEVPRAGLLLWCRLDEEIKERQLYQLAKKKGLLIIPGFVFYPYGYQGCGHIRLCFSKGSDEDIRRGVRLLGEALDECRKTDFPHSMTNANERK